MLTYLELRWLTGGCVLWLTDHCVSSARNWI